MMPNRKFKILLLQLLSQEFLTRPDTSNIPLAAGYLKAQAYKENLLTEIDIEIFDLEKMRNTTSPGDAKLIDLIISKSPDLIGFSLYCFNSMQSLFIAEQIKKRLPDVKIVVGGPEVTPETGYILNNPSVDLGCIGQGELTFIALVKKILNGEKNYKDVKGIFYKDSGRVTVTPPRESIKEIDQIPSPYLLGFINLGNYSQAAIETQRGCPFKCSYCDHWVRPRGYFSADRIYEELKIIIKNRIKHVFILDSAFIPSRHFHEICERIKDINRKKEISFFANVFAEYLDKKKADLLKECNFIAVEAGLQSIHSATLKNINRPSLNKEKFLNGMQLLKERDIQCYVGLIAGLPEDSLEDFKKTLEFLNNNEISSIGHLLQLYPGTSLREKAKQFGIKYQNEPPYLIIETPYISRSEIEEALTLASGKPATRLHGTLIGYSDPYYPRPQEKKVFGHFFESKQLNNNISKVILEVDSSCQTAEQLEMAGKRMSRIVCQPFTAWFKTQGTEENIDLIKSFCLPVETANPFLVWNIILESDDIFSVEVAGMIRERIFAEEKLVSDSRRMVDMLSIYAIFSWNDSKKEEAWLRHLNETIPFYWSLDISGENDWRKQVDALFREKYSSGILFDFDPQSEMEFITEALRFLHQKSRLSNKSTFCRNFVINNSEFLEQTGNAGEILTTVSYDQFESILSIDRNLDISSVMTSNQEKAIDLLAWQKRFQKTIHAEKSGH